MPSTTADATVTSKGQITIPKEIRDRLDLHSGSEVTFLLGDHEARLIPKTEAPLERLRSLREDIQFTAEEVETMKSESQDAWSDYE
jgi:AbrB family looped-hinge helix DNA binding protein